MKLNENLETCHWPYNHLLEMRKNAYEQEGKSLSLYQQQETFSMLMLNSGHNHRPGSHIRNDGNHWIIFP